MATTAPTVCKGDCGSVYNVMNQLSRGKIWLCDPDNLLASLPACVDCLERNDEGIEAIATEFKELMDRCGPTWSVQQNNDAISLANRFGYSFMVAGPTWASTGGSVSAGSSASTSDDDDVSTATTIPPAASVSIVTMMVTSTPTPPGSAMPSGSPGVTPTPASTSPPSSAATESTSTNQAWIAGAVIGPVAAITIVIAVVWLLLRRSRRKQQQGHRIGGGGGIFGKPELHANGIKQIVSAELRAEKRRKSAGPVELPGHVHYGAMELPVVNGDENRKLAADVSGDGGGGGSGGYRGWNGGAEKSWLER